jgi:hypothetical protein
MRIGNRLIVELEGGFMEGRIGCLLNGVDTSIGIGVGIGIGSIGIGSIGSR